MGDARVHLQRLLILGADAVVVVGYFLPWSFLRHRYLNAFDHLLFRVPFVVFALAIAVLALVGKRSARVGGPALGTLVILALLIGGMAGLIAYALASSKWIAWDAGAGPFVTIIGALLVAILGYVVGRPAKPTVGSTLTDWNRR